MNNGRLINIVVLFFLREHTWGNTTAEKKVFFLYLFLFVSLLAGRRDSFS